MLRHARCFAGMEDETCFEQEGARKAPDGRCSLENGVFPLSLEAGDNEGRGGNRK